MENIKITDNELKIDINNLKSEIDKSYISYDELHKVAETLVANQVASRFYLTVTIVSLTIIFFAPIPIIPAGISLLAFLRRKQINKEILKLKEEFNDQYKKINLEQSNLLLKKSELEFKETILDYRNGKTLTEKKINNLNVFSTVFEEFHYEIQKINSEYNYIHNKEKAIVEGDDWIFIPIENSESEKMKEKVLKGDNYGK